MGRVSFFSGRGGKRSTGRRLGSSGGCVVVTEEDTEWKRESRRGLKVENSRLGEVYEARLHVEFWVYVPSGVGKAYPRRGQSTQNIFRSLHYPWVGVGSCQVHTTRNFRTHFRSTAAPTCSWIPAKAMGRSLRCSSSNLILIVLTSQLQNDFIKNFHGSKTSMVQKLPWNNTIIGFGLVLIVKSGDW